jgi:hypothetical protein
MKWLIRLSVVFFLFSAKALDGDLFAQDSVSTPETAWSSAERIPRKQRSIGLIGSDRAQFYALLETSQRGTRYDLLCYDRKTMAQRGAFELKLPEVSGDQLLFHSLHVLEPGLLLLGTVRDRANDRMQAYGVWYDKKGQPLDLPILLAEHVPNRRSENPDFGFELSSDSTLLLIHHNTAVSRKANERFEMKVVDMALETVWQKEIELPYRADLLEINQYLLDPGGHVYMMTGISTEKSRLRTEERPLSEKRYVLITYNPDQNKVKEYEVELNNKWVIATAFDLAPNGDLAIGGFYSNDRYFSIAGTFFFRIDGETKKVLAKGMKAFDQSFLEQFMSERRAEKGSELDNFYFDHFVLDEDGGATFVGEQFFVTQRFRSDITTGRQEIQYFYHYNDLIVVDVNPDGTIHWATKIAKNQVSMNDRGPYSSYAFTRQGDQLYFVFNDHPENPERLNADKNANPRSFDNIKRSKVSLVSMDDEGYQRRIPLFGSKDEQTVVRPKVHISPTPGEIFIYSQYRRHFRFGRMKF